jgi:predicted ATPase
MKLPHLIKITLLKEFRCLPKDLTIEFKPITVLVGDQGCGKSSLLKLLQENDDTYIDVQITEAVRVMGIDTYFFDTEKMNPRVRDIDDYTDLQGNSTGLSTGEFVIAKFKSHGEVLKQFTVDMIGKGKNCVLFVDEPEAALSPKNQYTLIKALEKAVSNNCQIIIATHCVPIINHFEQVYDMEAKSWVNSKEYLNKISNE